MARRVATDPAHRVGTLFVNPGGPGGPSSQFVGLFAHLLGKQIRDRFDIVGIDPRGIGRSSPVRCQPSQPNPGFPRNTVPLDRKQAKPLVNFGLWEADACADGGNEILGHMSTADTARDMDLVRQAVGDPKLSYYGVSYGTYLGATYAALFPNRVGHMVLDGVLDPVAWSTGRRGTSPRLPFTTRLRSGVGAWEALVSAFNECDRVGRVRCRLAGRAADEWRRIVHRLRKGPARVTGGTLTYSDVINGTLSALYARSEYRFLMRDIHRMYVELFGRQRRQQPNGDLAGAFRSLARSRPGPYGGLVPLTTARKLRSFSPTFEGVICADTLNPHDPYAWVRAGRIADRMGPWFGRAWTWLSNPCATWPDTNDDAFFGPWRVHPASHVLLVSNFHDPATPIRGGRVLNTLLDGSRLLSLDTWGHGAIGESACVTARTSTYLLNGTLPPEGTVCRPDEELFPRRP